EDSPGEVSQTDTLDIKLDPDGVFPEAAKSGAESGLSPSPDVLEDAGVRTSLPESQPISADAINHLIPVTTTGSSAPAPQQDGVFADGNNTPITAQLVETQNAANPPPESGLSDSDIDTLLASTSPRSYAEISAASSACRTTMSSGSGQVVRTGMGSRRCMDASPDLVISTDMQPVAGFVHEQFVLTYTVTNQGDSATSSGSWWDLAILSDSSTDGEGEWICQGQNEHSGNLEPNESYTGTINFQIPYWHYGDISDGQTYYLFFKTDEANDVAESQEDNNVSSSGLPITLNIADIDLDATGMTYPASVQIGTPIDINMTVRNTGTDPATGINGAIWANVFASTDTDFDPWDDTWLGRYPVSGLAPLAPDSVEVTGTMSIVATGLSAGDYYLIVRVNLGKDSWDGENTQPEENTGNNTLVSASQISFTNPTMDLEVTAATAPDSATSGHPVELSWTVTNTGNSAAGVNTWTDYVYVSDDDAYSWGDALVTSETHEGGLMAGEYYDVTKTVNMPQCEGNYLIFYADKDGAQPEADNENNYLAIPITIDFLPADLIISDAHAPESADAGEYIDISWTVTNQETGTVAIGTWNDIVYLSKDNVLDDNDHQIGSYYRSAEILNSGESYTASITVQVPYKSGTHLIFVTDRSGNQPETHEDNNGFVLPITINYTPPDLVVTAASVVSGTVASGEQIDVSWTVENQGAGSAYGYWYDYVYLSYDDTYDDSDCYLNSFYNYYAGLEPNQVYTMTRTVSIPSNRVGNYLLFATDPDNSQEESNEENNTFALAVEMLSPDLVVTSASVDKSTLGSDYSGRTVEITYRVENQGDIEADATYWGSYWYDYFYLSDNSVLDDADRSLGYKYVSGFPKVPLAAGASYDETCTVTIPGDSTPGSKYILVVTDGYY
ncbi:MAG: hypothetical protein DRM98_05520, partial [Thermoplasmata archaeon]